MGNTEGSRAALQTFTTYTKLQLTQVERDMLIGCILGDAYIYPQGKICIEHGVKQQQYVGWLYDQLQRLRYPKLASVRRFDKRISKETVSIRFFLRQWFRPLRESFYATNRKSIPKCIAEWLSPRAIAIWYMDDGYLDKKKYPLFMTDGYKSEEVDILIQAFDLIGVKSFMTSHNRIRIAHESRKRFFSLIQPYMHYSMKYKLP